MCWARFHTAQRAPHGAAFTIEQFTHLFINQSFTEGWWEKFNKKSSHHFHTHTETLSHRSHRPERTLARCCPRSIMYINVFQRASNRTAPFSVRDTHVHAHGVGHTHTDERCAATYLHLVVGRFCMLQQPMAILTTALKCNRCQTLAAVNMRQANVADYRPMLPVKCHVVQR